MVLYHYVYVPVMRKNLYNTNDMSFAFLSNYDTRGAAMAGKIGPNQVWSEINVDKKKNSYTTSDWQNNDGVSVSYYIPISSFLFLIINNWC